MSGGAGHQWSVFDCHGWRYLSQLEVFVICGQCHWSMMCQVRLIFIQVLTFSKCPLSDPFRSSVTFRYLAAWHIELLKCIRCAFIISFEAVGNKPQCHIAVMGNVISLSWKKGLWVIEKCTTAISFAWDRLLNQGIARK